ncbi:hypothetical protein D8L93_02610 [Sodalis-like symbiont of Bactericera trigonica]|nr:hypothetical protein D8L93_02610 [Sodalis-like symbiont of Bactericera trigonica]
MEVVAAFRKQEVAVTIISPHPLPFQKQFGIELGTFFRSRHQEKTSLLSMANRPLLKGKNALAQ